MSQIIHTKDFGTIEIERSWVNGTMGIGVTPKGAYCHLSGLPVQSREELETVGMSADELADAVYWLDHRHDVVDAWRVRAAGWSVEVQLTAADVADGGAFEHSFPCCEEGVVVAADPLGHVADLRDPAGMT